MRDYEYRRLGTVSLVSDTHTSDDCINFLKIQDGKYPKSDKIRLILDNLSVHSSAKVQEYLCTVPNRFEFVFKSKQELYDRIYRYFDEINETPVIYRWTWNFDDIDPSETVQVTIL